MRTCREPSQADDAMAVTSCVIEISNESMPLHVTKKKQLHKKCPKQHAQRFSWVFGFAWRRNAPWTIRWQVGRQQLIQVCDRPAASDQHATRGREHPSHVGTLCWRQVDSAMRRCQRDFRSVSRPLRDNMTDRWPQHFAIPAYKWSL